MKVLLIQPPVEDFYHTRIRTYPLGLIYLATKIKDLCEVKIIDLRGGEKTTYAQNPFLELSEYYREEIYSPFSLFKRYSRFGSRESEIERIIRHENPDVLCVSSLFSAYFRESLRVAEIAKEVKSDLITVFGGHHPTALPGLVLEEKSVDFVIRGEGEKPLFRLLFALIEKKPELLSQIEGLCYKEKGRLYISQRISFEEDVDTIPERSLINEKEYKIGKKTYAFLITSRGCPNSCSFCSKMAVPYRMRSLRSIEEEIEILKGIGVEWIDFEDDMLIFEEERFLEILNLLKGKEFVLSAMNGIYIESLSGKILKEMGEAGFKKINLSIVDLSPCVLSGQKRRVPKNAEMVFKTVESSDMNMEIHFIIGLPNQSIEDVLRTMSYLAQIRCLLGPSVYYLSPTNPYVEEALGEDWTRKLNYMRSSVLFPVNPSFTRKSLFTVLKLARFVNFLKRFVDSIGVDISLREVKLGNPVDDEILSTLLKEKRFVAYDRKKRDFFEEPQEREVVSRFFKIMEGRKIKGYKTAHLIDFVGD